MAVEGRRQMTKKEKRQPVQSTGRERPSSAGEEKRQPVQSTRCPDTIDLEDLLEWMLLNPESYPDNQWPEETDGYWEPTDEDRYGALGQG